MGHNRETQTHSDDVPNTIRRNGTYYYNRRIPSDLVEVAAFGLKKGGKPQDFIKYSLRTKDPRKARRRVSTEDAKAEQDFEEKRQELAAEGRKGFDRTTNSEKEPKRRLASLSGPERRDLILELFVTMERQARASKHRELAETAPDRNEAIKTSSADLAVFEGSTRAHRPEDWDRELGAFLKERGIEIDSIESESFVEMRDLLKRAYIENEWRTLHALQGDTQEERDSFFRGWGAESQNPDAKHGSGITIEALCESYKEAKKAGGVSQASLDKYPMQFRILKEFFGEGREISSIKVEQAKQFADFLGKIPRNSTKRYPSLLLVKAAEREARKSKPEFLAAKTQRDHFMGAASIFRYAVEMEWLDASPLRKQVVSSRLPKAERQDKPMLSPDEMSKIFGSEEFIGERNALTNRERGEARFWVPLLCLFHGFRTNEVCQLLVADVKREDGIDFLHLRETDDEGKKVKRLKSAASRRMVPLHSELVNMGFLELVERRKAAEDSFLFPSLEANRRGSKADGIGKWFGRLRNKLVKDLPDVQGAKGLHSLRHSFARACRDKGIARGIVWALGGWSDGRGRNSEGDYGSGYGLSTLREAIDKIEYPGVDFTPLYPS